MVSANLDFERGGRIEAALEERAGRDRLLIIRMWSGRNAGLAQAYIYESRTPELFHQEAKRYGIDLSGKADAA